MLLLWCMPWWVDLQTRFAEASCTCPMKADWGDLLRVRISECSESRPHDPQWKDSVQGLLSAAWPLSNIRALVIRIGFWVFSCDTYNEDPPPKERNKHSMGDYLGPQAVSSRLPGLD